MTLLAELDARLQALHPRTAETPLFNPVFQLSLELSRRLDGRPRRVAHVGNLPARHADPGAPAERLLSIGAGICGSEPRNLVRRDPLYRRRGYLAGATGGARTTTDSGGRVRRSEYG